MKSTVLGVACLAATNLAVAQEIASCRDPEGPTYFHFAGAEQKSAAGWTTDRIRGGRVSLVKAGDQLDILYSDIRAKPISSNADGGKVVLLGYGQDAVTVLVHYQTSTEIYTFFNEKDGTTKYTMLQTKTGASVPFPKSALLLGACDPLNLKPLQ